MSAKILNLTDTNNFNNYIISDLDIDNTECQYSIYNKQKQRLNSFTFFNKKNWNNYIDHQEDDKTLTIIGNVFIHKKRYKEITEDYTKEDKIDDKNYGLVRVKLSSEYIKKHKLKYEYAKFDLKNSNPTNKNLYLKTIGYAQVGSNEYVRLVKYSFLPFIIFLLLLFLIVGVLLGFNDDNNKTSNINEVNGNPITSTTQGYTNNELANNHYLYIWNSKTVDENHKTVALVNHPENDVYLCYDIYDENGNKLDSTGSFQPNTQIDYDFYSLFNGKKGKYNLTLLIKVNDWETKEPLCSKTMPVVITVQ